MEGYVGMHLGGPREGTEGRGAKGQSFMVCLKKPLGITPRPSAIAHYPALI